MAQTEMETQGRRHGSHASDGQGEGIDWKGYGRLLAMVLTSTVVMYFFMYWNIYRLEDFRLSETRAYMSVLMGGTMLAIMLAFMLHMYKSKAVNLALFGLSAVLFAAGLWLVRSQETVQDGSWMKSMIPHHSIAIMVSERAEITDPRVRKLADEIIAAQEKEIAEMDYLIRALETEGEVGEDFPLGETEGPTRVAADLVDALSVPAVAGLDAGGMTAEEVAQVVPDATCTFRFAEGQQAQLAAGPGGGAVIKINGALLPLAGEAGAEGGRFEAEGIAMTVAPLPGGEGSTLLLELATEPALRVGYDGVYACGA
ncbi:MAG: DUF305 domain-containing protein [Shimia sp.]